MPGGVDLTVVLAYTVGLIIAYLLLRMLWTPARLLLRVAYAVVIGAVAIALINLVGGLVQIHIPFNAVSVLSAGLLGLPGIVLVLMLGNLL